MRTALYFAPPASAPLTAAGSSFLGRDAFTGRAVDQPAVPGLDAAAVAEMTADPRRYGFHATLKPPFALAEGRDLDGFVAAVRAFAAARPAFTVALAVRRLGGFLALVPAGEALALNALADAAVADFEPFRRPSDPADLARRRGGLTERQERNLETFGYPYVFEDFRFHMTLSRRLADAEAALLQPAAEAHFADLVAAPVAIDTLAVFVEPSPGAPFTVHATVPLGAASSES